MESLACTHTYNHSSVNSITITCRQFTDKISGLKINFLHKSDLNDNGGDVSNILSVKFEHVRCSLVETEATLTFPGRLLYQLSLQQFAFRTFDCDINL